MKKYCIYCGTEHEAEAEYCWKCSRKLDPEENLLKDYLISKTKDTAKGKLEDSLFELIKNYLMSHAYGIILTISVMFTASTAIVSASPVEIVHAAPNSSLPENDDPVVENYTPSQSFPLDTSDEEWYLHDIIKEYLNLIQYDFDEHPEIYEKMISYHLPGSYGYFSSFELTSIPFDSDASIMYSGSISQAVADGVPSTALGNQLVSDGHRIAELEVVRTKEQNKGDEGFVMLAYTAYHVTFAQIDG